jgi:hypothetical protein
MRSPDTPQWSDCRQIEASCRFSPHVDQKKWVAGSRKARPSTNRSGPNILVSFGRKTGGGAGVCITHSPHYQYRLNINRRVWGFGLTQFPVQATELHPCSGALRAVLVSGCDCSFQQSALREIHPFLHGTVSIPTQSLHKVGNHLLRIFWTLPTIWTNGMGPGLFCTCASLNYVKDPMNQCCRSMTFLGGSGSGSADPCLWLMDPDPGSWFCYFRHWLIILTQFFLLITFWRYIYIIFQR